MKIIGAKFWGEGNRAALVYHNDIWAVLVGKGRGQVLQRIGKKGGGGAKCHRNEKKLQHGEKMSLSRGGGQGSGRAKKGERGLDSFERGRWGMTTAVYIVTQQKKKGGSKRLKLLKNKKCEVVPAIGFKRKERRPRLFYF